MNKKYIFIALAVIALIAMGAIGYLVVKSKKDNESAVLDWISSPTA